MNETVKCTVSTWQSCNRKGQFNTGVTGQTPVSMSQHHDVMSKLVSVGYLCDLQGLFSEIDNLCTVNCNELQLLS